MCSCKLYARRIFQFIFFFFSFLKEKESGFGQSKCWSECFYSIEVCFLLNIFPFSYRLTYSKFGMNMQIPCSMSLPLYSTERFTIYFLQNAQFSLTKRKSYFSHETIVVSAISSFQITSTQFCVFIYFILESLFY